MDRYKFSSILPILQQSPIYKETIDECHIRCSTRILQGCLSNGGLFIKLGQGLSTMNHILPPQYISTLEKLHDKATPKNFSKVIQVFREDLGKEPSDLFAEFNEEPIAAASLAQVHDATLLSGERVAVKVQYYDLQSRFHSDIRTIETLLSLVEIIHPSFGFSWVLKEMKETLAQELDFKHEAENSKRCAMDLAHLHNICVPKVYDNLCTKRILTAEYIVGIKTNETSKLKDAKVSLRWLDQTMVEAFSYQLFHTGFVHADPHPGNVFVRINDHKKPQLVILDHGLYEYMPDTLRLHLCGLIKSLIGQDYKQTEIYSHSLGVKDWETLGEIVLQHPLNASNSQKEFKLINAKLTKEDIEYMKKKASEHFDKIMSVLKDMPKPMLLFISGGRIVEKYHGYGRLSKNEPAAQSSKNSCKCTLMTKAIEISKEGKMADGNKTSHNST